MGKIKRTMTGSSWHVKKKEFTPKFYAKHCKNCIYYDQHVCQKTGIRFTYNNADICKYYVNGRLQRNDEKHSVLDSKNGIRSSVVERADRKDLYVPYGTNIILVNIKQIELNRINSLIDSKKEYVYYGCVDISVGQFVLNRKDLRGIILYDMRQYYKCSYRQFQTSKRGRFIILSFKIISLKPVDVKRTDFKTVALGKDETYGKTMLLKKITDDNNW